MTTPTKPLRDYGPIQMGDRLGLTQWQIDRALTDGLIPPPDNGARWSAELVEDAAERVEAIKVAVGSVPDMGATRAADFLAERFCTPVPADAIPELAAVGLLPIVGDYKGNPLYCGRTLEAFTDRAAVEQAVKNGRLLTRAEAARHLGIRDSDFDHLVRAGLIVPRSYGLGPFQSRRSRPNVPLFRAGDLGTLLDRDDIDWAAVRSTPRGFQSPLAKLPTATDKED